MGIEATIKSIKSAIKNALSDHPSTRGCSLRSTIFTSAWVGIAGYDRPAIQPKVDQALSELFRLPLGDESRLMVTTDIDLLPATVTSKPNIDSALVLVAGTGSIAMRYQRHQSGFVRTGRAGGWGHLLGDDGSGYSLGREAARIALQASDVHRSTNPKSDDLSNFSPLAAAILKHLQTSNPTCRPDDVLSGILGPGSASAKTIAQFAQVVLDMAEFDAETNDIVDAGAASLAKLVVLLAEGDKLDISGTALILGGGLMQNQLYQSKVLELLRQKLGDFAHVEFIPRPAFAGAQHLLSRLDRGQSQ